MLVDYRLGTLGPDQAKALLAHATFTATADHLNWLLTDLYTESAVSLYGWTDNGPVTGLIGIRQTAPAVAEILHVAVAEGHRLQGIGRRMVEAVIAHHQLAALTAETDKDAVDFYRRCGFVVTSLGQMYLGGERFLCTRTMARKPSA
ncbi:MAG: GNAT family N-acetyltransferase [Sulfobacillus sp.]